MQMFSWVTALKDVSTNFNFVITKNNLNVGNICRIAFFTSYVKSKEILLLYMKWFPSQTKIIEKHIVASDVL